MLRFILLLTTVAILATLGPVSHGTKASSGDGYVSQYTLDDVEPIPPPPPPPPPPPK